MISSKKHKVSQKVSSLLNKHKDSFEDKWVRPADWLPMPAISKEEFKFVGLYAVFPDTTNEVVFFNNNVTFGSVTSDLLIDWGDGTVETWGISETKGIFNLGVAPSHAYNYNSLPANSYCSRGYKTVVITVTPVDYTKGFNLVLGKYPSTLGRYAYLTSANRSNWLDIIFASGDLEFAYNDNGNNRYSSLYINEPDLTGTGVAISTSYAFAYLEHFAWLGKNQFHNAYLAGYTAARFERYFQFLNNLKKITSIYTDKNSVASFAGICVQCNNLLYIPETLTQCSSNYSNAFFNCYAINYIKFTGIPTGLVNCFRANYNLNKIDLPIINTTSLNTTFYNCVNLKTFKTTSLQTITDIINAFQFCSSLIEVDITLPAPPTSLLYATCFNLCYSLKTYPSWINLGNSSSTYTNAFTGCLALTYIHPIDFTTGTSALTLSSLQNLQTLTCQGLVQNLDITRIGLDKTNLEILFNSLGIPTASRTLTITGTKGAEEYYTLTGSITTNSKTISIPSGVTGIKIGTLITGTGISTSVAVTTTASSDKVNLSNHGLENGTKVSFVTTTSTGLTIYTPYFVINKTTNDFQLSTTLNGNVIDITSDGSGTIIYPTYVTAVDSINNTITISVPAKATNASASLTFSLLDTSIATLKRWTITR